MEENELFEAYLYGQLTAAEKLALEQRFKTDAPLKERFDFYKTVQADMENWQATAAARAQLRETLTGEAAAAVPVVRKLPFIRRYQWAFSAAAALIVTLAIWKFMGMGGAATGQDLYVKYAAEDVSFGSRGNNTDSLLALASALMFDKKYSEAAATLQGWAGKANEPALYLGYCQMQAGNHTEAEKNLDAVIAAGNPYMLKARWFRALLLLKTDRREACKKELELVINGSAGDYSTKARQLLQALQ